MRTEGQETTETNKVTFHTKHKELFICSRQSSVHFRHDVIHNTEEGMSFISTDKINQHF
jgi:hypothetical protein